MMGQSVYCDLRETDRSSLPGFADKARADAAWWEKKGGRFVALTLPGQDLSHRCR